MNDGGAVPGARLVPTKAVVHGSKTSGGGHGGLGPLDESLRLPRNGATVNGSKGKASMPANAGLKRP